MTQEEKKDKIKRKRVYIYIIIIIKWASQKSGVREIRAHAAAATWPSWRPWRCAAACQIAISRAGVGGGVRGPGGLACHSAIGHGPEEK